jgi:hypothetical protein
MKKVIWGAITAILLFVAVIAIVMWNNFGREQQDTNYGQQQEPTLPTVSFNVLGRDANLLFGCRSQENSVELVDTMLPVRAEGEIPIWIHTDGVLVDSAQVLLYSLDGTNLIEQADLNLSGTQELTGVYQMTALAEVGTSYLMTLKLELADRTACYYSMKVCQYPDEEFDNKEELLTFAEEFSNAACDKDQEHISSYISYDRDLAGTDLSDVNLHTDMSLVTWAGLTVQKKTQYVQIYEWYNTQVSISLRYDAGLSYGTEESLAAVHENFCIRERDEKLFLLDYERSCREYFSGNADSVGNTSILLGIQQSDSCDLLYTDYGINIYFTVDGGVWHYNYNTNTLTTVFSFGENREDQRLDPERYAINLVGIQDGMLYFTVQGYMESGRHEGSCGLALYGYDILTGVCREYMYADLTGASGEGTLQAFSQDGLFYTNIGDSIYGLDLAGGDVLKLYEGIDGDTLTVNAQGSMAAWQYIDAPAEICLLDTNTSMLQTITEERELKILGFIDDDLVYGRRAVEQLSREGFVYQHFLDQICIVDGALERKALYEKDQILIGDVEVTDSGVSFARYSVDGNVCTPMTDDVIFLAGEEQPAGVVELKVAASENKRNYYYINLGRTVTADRVSLEEANLLETEPVQFDAQQPEKSAQRSYGTYIYGSCVSENETLTAAIQAAYERMGVVYSEGYLSEPLWNRDARDLYLTMTLPTMTWTQEGHEEEMAAMSSLERGVDIFVYAGVNAGVVDRALAQSSARAACETVYEELKLTFGEHLLDLTGSRIGYLLYYINLRHPVLCLTEEDTALIITGYTSTELMIYDPATRETSRMNQDDAQTYFDQFNTIFVSF